MSVNPEIDELVAELHKSDGARAADLLEQLSQAKGRAATRALTEYLSVAPAGLLATRAAMALEKRKHKSCLPALYQIYEERPELAEDIIPIFSAMEDADAVPYVVSNLRPLLASPARLSTLTFLLKCADPEALVEILLSALVLDPVPGAADDIVWAIDEVLSQAEEELIEEVAATARTLGPQALKVVEPFLPAKSELEVQAPVIAAALLAELVRTDLLELAPTAGDALVEIVANAICEARSPKALVRDVERILLESTAVEELYGDRDDIRKAFQSIAKIQ